MATKVSKKAKRTQNPEKVFILVAGFTPDTEYPVDIYFNERKAKKEFKSLKESQLFTRIKLKHFYNTKIGYAFIKEEMFIR